MMEVPRRKDLVNVPLLVIQVQLYVQEEEEEDIMVVAVVLELLYLQDHLIMEVVEYQLKVGTEEMITKCIKIV
jgi:hypothetical protein